MRDAIKKRLLTRVSLDRGVIAVGAEHVILHELVEQGQGEVMANVSSDVNHGFDLNHVPIAIVGPVGGIMP